MSSSAGTSVRIERSSPVPESITIGLVVLAYVVPLAIYTFQRNTKVQDDQKVLTGAHLMRTGVVEANLRVLNEDARLSYLDELIERKLAGPEKGVLPEADMRFHEAEYERLVDEAESNQLLKPGR